MSGVYYSEWDPFAAAWLGELKKAGLIPDGEIDTRSILDVRAADLRGFRQCHFFAGIGGWALAFILAGINKEKNYWSGSCPCQPFSSAGKRQGHADERHLWPAFYDLVDQCRPAGILGEQVTDDLGREWLAGIRADLEGAGYAFGAANLPACSVGAAHRRYRHFWVAYAQDPDRGSEQQPGGAGECGRGFAGSGADSTMANAPCDRPNGNARAKEGARGQSGIEPWGGSVGPDRAMGDTDSGRRSGVGGEGQRGITEPGPDRSLDNAADPRRPGHRSGGEITAARYETRLREFAGRGAPDSLGDAEGTGLEVGERDPGDAGQDRSTPAREGFEQDGGMGDAQGRGRGIVRDAPFEGDSRHAHGPSVAIRCADGKWRRVPANEAGEPEPLLFPLAYGVPNRVGSLRGAGNAIRPDLAAKFIQAAEDAQEILRTK